MNLVRNIKRVEEAKTDEHLVRLTLSDHSETFARLYDRHYLKIYRIAYGMTGNRESAEDLTQEIFLRAFQKLHQFTGAASFSTWLHRLAVNCSINYCRQEKKNRYHDSINDITLSTGASWEVEKEVIHRQMQQVIQNALSTLKPDLRMVVLLKDVEELSYEEIALRMDCAIGTVGTWLNRARLQLAKRLANYKGKF